MKLRKVKDLLLAPKDAEGLYLVVTPSQLVLDKDTNWKDGRSAVSIEVWRRKGNANPTQEGMGDYSVSVFKNGSSTVSVLKRNTPSFSVSAAKTDKSLEIVLIKGDTKVDTKTVTVSSDGKDGTNGNPGGNTATILLFKRSASAITAIDWSDTLTYTFATQQLASVPTGWTLNKVPSGNDPIYVTAATAYGTGTTDTIAASEWATPVLFVENGEHGLNSAPVFLYKRAASAPAKPTATLTYTFATGVLSGTLSGWSQNIPATDGNPCWVIQATAIGTGATDTIEASEWSKQEKLVADGSNGTGISSTTWYYLATTMATGVTRSTSGWTTSYQQGTPELPYVWRYGDTLLTNGTHQYTSCELIFSYSAGANPNLLEQTNFSSLQALDKWTTRNSLNPLSGVSLSQENYASITTGIQAHNAYYDRTTKTTAQIQYKEVLQQCLWNTTGTIKKLEPSTWYTLSFWAKGVNVATFIYPSVFDNTVISYKDGVMQNANTMSADAYILWSLSNTWKRHTFTFKTKSTIGSANQNLLFRLYPKASSSTLNDVYLCMPKLEVGMQATSYISNEESTHFGQVRNRRWAINTQYQAGKVDEQFDDTVLFGETGFFHCIKSHISTLDNAPNGTNGSIYWEATSKVAVLATDIFFAEKALINNLIATLIQTGYSGNPHIEAEGSEFKIFGKGQYPAIYLAINSDNKAVLRFQNENTGEFLYDLGPDGIMKEFSEVSDSYTEMKFKRLTNATRVSELLDIATSACNTYYRFNEGYKQIGSGSSATKQYHVSGGSSPSVKNAQFFTSKNYNGTAISDGWYVKPNNGTYMMMAADTAGETSVYVVHIYCFSQGKMVNSIPVYFRFTDSQRASKSVGCDENGNELSTSTYTYLYSYWQQNNITL